LSPAGHGKESGERLRVVPPPTEGEQMNKILVAATVAAGLVLVGLQGVASAAPITCSGNQTPVKTANGWACKNPGGNTSNSGAPKNPNVRKGFF
jgi:hypothetical protein